jgi:hypothetical protein
MVKPTLETFTERKASILFEQIGLPHFWKPNHNPKLQYTKQDMVDLAHKISLRLTTFDTLLQEERAKVA